MNAHVDTPLAGEAMASLFGLHWNDGQMTAIKELNSGGPVTASGHRVWCWVVLGPLSGGSLENTGPWKKRLPGWGGSVARPGPEV